MYYGLSWFHEVATETRNIDLSYLTFSPFFGPSPCYRLGKAGYLITLSPLAFLSVRFWGQGGGTEEETSKYLGMYPPANKGRALTGSSS